MNYFPCLLLFTRHNDWCYGQIPNISSDERLVQFNSKLAAVYYKVSETDLIFNANFYTINFSNSFAQCRYEDCI